MQVSRFPVRPDRGGTLGTPLTVISNVLRFTSLPDHDYIHYDVSVSPEVPPKLNRQIFAALEAQYKDTALGNAFIAYDGRKNFYTARPLPQDKQSVQVRLPGGKAERVFTVTFQRVSQLSLQALRLALQGKSDIPMDVLQALDVVMHQGPSVSTAWTSVGRCFFNGEGAVSLGLGVDLWRGLFESVRPTGQGLVLCVDQAASAFLTPGPVVSCIEFLLRGEGGGDRGDRGGDRYQDQRQSGVNLSRPLTDQQRHLLARHLKGYRIEVTHRGDKRRAYRVVGVSDLSADETRFTVDDGSQISVTQYFSKQYNLRLKYGHLPCLRVGSAQRSVFLPVECCSIVPGQRYLRSLTPDQTAQMIRQTASKPHVRQDTMRQGYQRLRTLQEEAMKAFGLSLSSDWSAVQARILPAPRLQYKEETVQTNGGAWNMAGKRLDQPGETLRQWSVVHFGGCQQSNVEQFVMRLGESMERMGLQVADKRPVIVQGRTHDVTGSMRMAHQAATGESKSPVQLILVVLPNNGTALYNDIKRVGDTQAGIVTQCVLAKHVYGAKEQYLANVALKINSKLGGRNVSLAASNPMPFMSERPTMVLGADLSHSTNRSFASQSTSSSVAAVVASLDRHLSRFASATSSQPAGLDLIVDLKSMVKKLLTAFYRQTRQKPERLLFYRNGVSEGQFAAVQQAELLALKEACQELEKSYSPTITFVIVQKRHRLRFFPSQSRDADRSGNIPAGTVIDLGVTHPTQFQFYLCAHSGIQGTSRPTCYHVLHDDHQFTSDTLQLLTYQMCYLFARCTRSVSVVPSVYYASLVATRGRIHAQWSDGVDSNSSLKGGSVQKGESGEEKSTSSSSLPPVVGGLDQGMYFL